LRNKYTIPGVCCAASPDLNPAALRKRDVTDGVKPEVCHHSWRKQCKRSSPCLRMSKMRSREMKYAVLYAPTSTGYSAHVPDLPGCIGAAATLEETRRLMKEAIEGHLECMREFGYAIPEPTTVAEQVEIPI